MRRRRLDAELIRRGLFASAEDAAEAVAAGRVTVAGRTVGNPASLVARDEPIRVLEPPLAHASRGGAKLAAALARFGVDPSGRRCLDAGASTGGFTDVLLDAGAASVVAVDVGYGQLSWRLRRDPRVTVMERTNVRDLRPGDLPGPVDLVTADLSFVSLVTVLPALVPLGGEGSDLVLLVKPQFEARRGEVEAGGLVTDPAVWLQVLDRVASACRDAGAGPLAAMASPLPGPAGNVEFFIHARLGHPGRTVELEAVVAEGTAVREAS
ncbi:MAG TPA: TlyA family RNA methyltransferase [Actinomycetota bacterium]|nr:TlyA family RNA methyltransferase [Actinomycetota bacterium]